VHYSQLVFVIFFDFISYNTDPFICRAETSRPLPVIPARACLFEKEKREEMNDIENGAVDHPPRKTMRRDARAARDFGKVSQ
jgi:hypothetical protein